MENEGKKIRFRNGGKKYLAEFISDQFVSQDHQGTFIKPLAMFRIWDEQQNEVVGCVTFTEHLLIDSVWAQPHKKHFPSSYRVEALVNLLHYLPFDPVRLKEIYHDCYEYRFDRNFGDDQARDRLYKIKANDSFEATFQKIMFGDTVTNQSIQNAALEVMFNHWEDNPDTNVLVEVLASVLPVREIDLIKNLKLLLSEDKIHAITSPGDPQKLISVGLEPPTIRELEGEVKSDVKYPSVVKNIYGPNIETTTHGANSPVSISMGKIETVFENLQKEIGESPELKDEEKQRVSQTVKELKAEIAQDKDPKKVGRLVEKLKGSANWVWQKILANPYVSGVIVEILMKATI